MKKSLQNKLKLGLVAICMLSVGAVSAQKVTGDVTKTEDASKSKVLNGTIRVVDNKGTKKFLQVKNGLTLLTDATPDGGIVSTWQLGGTLSDNTYIDATGKIFSLDGLKLVAPTTAAATAATTQSIGSNGTTISGTGTAATETGWTVLIRDEKTGEIQKLLVTDLVKGGHLEVAAAADATQPTLTDITIPLAYEKVWVYRNGAKLRANVDYTIATGGVVTLDTTALAPNDWAIYKGDVFEVQWIQ
ncbi:hypothetical protein [Flavobacterium sp. 7A]|uniref:hypothetical protein n=1 Tax=Flavobacterium sp. 7A TaxID=2940571 RepID=UPI002226F5FA|nr:hypothetical protein [Flavobacterium sp. 7A]MCW2119854.1 hypothetical protein [Flavobacterium sp. 7A]